jgi:hypothetical protein
VFALRALHHVLQYDVEEIVGIGCRSTNVGIAVMARANVLDFARLIRAAPLSYKKCQRWSRPKKTKHDRNDNARSVAIFVCPVCL